MAGDIIIDINEYGNLMKSLAYYKKEAEKALKRLEKLLESKAHVSDKTFRLTYELGDITEYVGACVSAKKMLPHDKAVDEHFKISRNLHRKGYEFRDKFVNRLRAPITKRESK